jgi:hypothetical protein
MIAAHVAGVPVEELVAPFLGSGAALVAARGLLALLLHRHRDV